MTNSTLISRDSTVQNVTKISSKSSHISSIEDSKAIRLIDQDFPMKIYWTNVFLCVTLHTAAVYGLYIFLMGRFMWQSFVFQCFVFCFSGLGVTAGCHRYWAHRSYKAKLPLRILLGIMQTYAFQYSIYDWSRTHRVHHKYSETNADPHNVHRGFFFAQLGWLLTKEHPAVAEKMSELDFSDLEADPIVMFQKRYYWRLVILCAFSIPLVCIAGWGESYEAAFFYVTFYGFAVSMNITGLVNSAAHIWGGKPFDKFISPADNYFVAFASGGEGSHNFHHTFPWDYKADEFGFYWYNATTAFLHFMAWIGWAYDLKTVSKELIAARVERTGDGTHGEKGLSDKLRLNKAFSLSKHALDSNIQE